MKINNLKKYWTIIFGATVLFYCLVFAPVGINETDGGFLSGLAWQVLSGKEIYLDAIYVRPPLPVFLRAFEIWVLPENLEVLGERWFFYLKIATYSWLAADLLTAGRSETSLSPITGEEKLRPTVATLSFIISAHNFPPMAWHTVDGVFFSVLGFWFLNRDLSSSVLPILKKLTKFEFANLKLAQFSIGGFLVSCSLLCKQSFYPMAAVLLAFLYVKNEKRVSLAAILGFAVPVFSLLFWLWQNESSANFFEMTSGSATAKDAFQHGFLDYFRISPLVAVGVVFALLAFGFGHPWIGRKKLATGCWGLFLVWLVATFVFQVIERQAFTAPFAQARLLLWLAAGHCFWLFYREWDFEKGMSLAILIAISWCSSISWGYNLPVLLAVPGVFAAISFGKKWARNESLDFELTSFFTDSPTFSKWVSPAVFLLIGVFWATGQFVYRDENRSELNVNLGAVYPKLNGVFSSPETAAKYAELKKLNADFGKNSVVLPAFPQADFLEKKFPVLPLNWVVNRETNGRNSLIFNILKEKRPIIFIEKIYGEKLLNDPQFEVTKEVLLTWERVGETRHFWIYKYEN